MKNCCVNCFCDNVIRDHIREISKATGKCSYCYKSNKSLATPKELSKFLLDGIERAYIGVNQTGYDPSYKVMFPEKYTVHDILIEIEFLSTECKDHEMLIYDLVTAMDSTEGEEVMDVEENISSCKYFKKNELYERDYNYINSWNYFKKHIVHHSRYFDNLTSDKIIFLNKICDLLNGYKKEIKGEVFWRARIMDQSDDSQHRKPKRSIKGILSVEPIRRGQKLLALGPPPLDKTFNCRMSPAGIAYLYVSEDIETCLAELKPDVGDEVWLGCFALRKKITILDLSKVSYIKSLSIFEKNFENESLPAYEFIDEFQRDIAKPVGSKNTHCEYVSTQVFAEFIRNRGIKGIKYKSSQKDNGVNYVFFFNNNKADYSLHGTYNNEKLDDNFSHWFWLKEYIKIKIESNSYKFTKSEEELFKKYRVAKKSS